MRGAQDGVKPVCPSIGADGDLYGLIGGVASTLEIAGLKSEAEDFVGRAILSGRYDEVLDMSRDYVQFPSGGSNEPASQRITRQAP